MTPRSLFPALKPMALLYSRVGHRYVMQSLFTDCFSEDSLLMQVGLLHVGIFVGLVLALLKGSREGEGRGGINLFFQLC